MKRLQILLIFVVLIIVVFAGITMQSHKNTTPLNQKITPPADAQNNSVQISRGGSPDIPLHVPDGYTIHVFADTLDNPRDLSYSPGGTLVVSNPAGGQILALPDRNHDGIADTKKVIIDDQNHPHGVAFYGGKLYVADVDRVLRYNWNEQNVEASLDKVLFSLPPNDDHNNRTLTFDQNGIMYISVGSTCDVCNESSNLSGTVLISNMNGDTPKVFATGLRNAPFLTISPDTNKLWATEMGRDHLGDDIPPDEIDIIENKKNYGWPYCYGDKVHDDQFDPSHTHTCGNTIAPIYQIPAHSAPLGLTFINSSQFPTDWQNDLLVAYHGSWNRSTPVGYKIVHMKVEGDTISQADDFLTGFLPGGSSSGDNSLGRPVDVIFDKEGNLYVSDDKAGTIYIIQNTNAKLR